MLAATHPAEGGPIEAARAYDRAIGRLKGSAAYVAHRKGRLIFGTDTPSAPTYANPPGLNGFWELQRLFEAGVSPPQIFRAATIANAEALGLGRELGTVEAKKRANLLLLREDPTRSTHAYATIEKIILRGRVLDALELEPNHVQPGSRPN